MGTGNAPGNHQRGTLGTALRGAWSTAPKGYKPPRDRMVKVKDAVPCPVCKAEVGEHCRGLSAGGHHLPRRRMALRQERGEA